MALTVAIVDDSRVSRMMVVRLVKQVLPDCAIVEAASADEAVGVIANQKIDRAILDLNMPGRDGLELALELTAQGFDPGQIALLTANVQESVRERVHAAGIEFMSKPLKIDELRPFLDESASTP